MHKNTDTHTGQPGNSGGGGSWLLPMLPFLLHTCVGVTKFKSLNSLLTAEAIKYVNFNKANIMTGEEIYKMFSYGPQSGLDLSEWPRLVLLTST